MYDRQYLSQSHILHYYIYMSCCTHQDPLFIVHGQIHPYSAIVVEYANFFCIHGFQKFLILVKPGLHLKVMITSF